MYTDNVVICIVIVCGESQVVITQIEKALDGQQRDRPAGVPKKLHLADKFLYTTNTTLLQVAARTGEVLTGNNLLPVSFFTH